MIIRDRKWINATPQRVWEILKDPELMELWNSKCVHCRAGGQTVHPGLVYEATFRLGRRESKTKCEVIACIPGEVLTTRFSGEAFRNGGYVEETFRLTPKEGGRATHLVHEVDYKHSRLPILIRFVMWHVKVFGRAMGKSSLDGIQELAEG